MIQLLPRRGDRMRVLTLVALLVATVIVTLFASVNSHRPEGSGVRPFALEGWAYGRILPPGVGERYRLRVDIARVPPARSTDAAPQGDEARPAEFRVLLERADKSNFVCLRWVENELELVRIAGGERAPLLGQTSYPLPCIARDEPAAGAQSINTLVIYRSPGLWTVSHRDRELIVAGDPHAKEMAQAGDSAWGALGGWRLTARALQPGEEIHFDDCFAKVNFNEDGTYDVREGLWDLDAARQAERSVNAFRLRGRSRPAEGGSKPALAVFGRSFWRAYRAEAAIKFRNAGAGGLVFAARRDSSRSSAPASGSPSKKRERDADERVTPALARYGLLRWRYPEGTGAPGGLEVLDVRVRRAPGGKTSRRETTLLSLPWTPRREQWHRVAVSLFDRLGEVEVNGARAVFGLPPGLRSGECGLFADSEKGVLFDDIRVASHGEFLHRSASGPAPWLAQSEGMAALYRLPAGPAWLRLGFREDTSPQAVSWLDASGAAVSVRIDPATGMGEATRTLEHDAATPAEAGPPAPRQVTTERLARFEAPGPGDYCLKIGDHECTVLRGPSGVASFALGSPREGSVTIDSPEALAEVAGGALAPRPALRHKAGTFGEVDVRARKNGKGLNSQRTWIGFVGWLKDKSSWTEGPDGLIGCKTLLWGPCEASVEVPLPKEGEKPVALRLVPDAPDAEPAGLAIGRSGDGFAILDAQGNELGPFAPPATPDGEKDPRMKLALRRAGGNAEVFVAGRRVFDMRLPAGAPVRVEARAPGLAPEAVSIRSDRVDESHFDKAPTEWTRWRGHWDVTSKWQCDPRYTFLGMWSDELEKKSDVAGAFSRACYLGDQDLQIYFAFRDVLGNRYGDGRRYVRRDMNFVFACEDEDPASGYCLMFGGFDNRGTQLLRRGKLVKETDKFKFGAFHRTPTDIHWQWYCLHILRRGGDITVTLNGDEIISWTDPDPLEGGHVGAWTLGGGMILGRTRFSAERRGAEMPGFAMTPSTPPVGGWWAVEADHAARLAQLEDGPAPVGGGGLATRVVRVTNPAAGGHLGVAHSADGKEGAPAALAFRAPPWVRVRAYAVSASAAKPGMPLGLHTRPKRILPARDKRSSKTIPALPADGKWHVLPMPEPLPKGKVLVIGNWESDGYAAAGIGANGVGDSYEVGVFPTVGEARSFVCRQEEGEFLAALPPNPRGKAEAHPAEGGTRRLDVLGDWQTLQWGNPAKVRGHRSSGGRHTALVLRASEGNRGRAVVRLAQSLPLAAKGTLRLDVYNATEREVPVAFGVWSGADFVYSESRPQAALPARWNHIEFDLAARDFKTARSGWKHESRLIGPGDVREVALLLYGDDPAALAVENLEADVDAKALVRDPLSSRPHAEAAFKPSDSAHAPR